MNRKVWIIKICKALNQLLWGICRSVLAPDSDPTHTLAPSHKAREERGLLPAGLLYKQVLESSSKCFFSLTGLPHPWAFHRFLLPHARCSHLSYRKHHKTASCSALTPDLHQPSSPSAVSEPLAPRARRGVCCGVPGSQGLAGWAGASSAPGGDVEASDHHEVGLAEVDAALQALRDTLQRLQVLQGIQLPDLLQVNCKEEET